MKKKVYANLFYFREILKIGGTEQFLYEIAKKYHKYDITILYDNAELNQLVRLKKLVRCIKRDPNEIYYAKKAFYNFNLEALDQVEADEHIFICHAIYQEIPLAPPLTYPKLTGYIGVSDYACRELKKYAEAQGRKIAPKRVYNPLTLEEPGKVVKIISACRLDDEVKGGKRTLKLIEALDKYCEETGNHYIWHIFTNKTDLKLNSPNVVFMEPRADIRPYIADADYLAQLSNDMESYCYSINEALSYGTRIIRTPLSVAKELKIPKSAEIVAEWDMSNAEEVAKNIFETKEPFKYQPPKDGWGETLVKDKSTYTPEDIKVMVKPKTTYYDLERQETMETWHQPYEVELNRAKMLVNRGYVEVIE